jgi:arylsulfatase A-like enzyme/Tfp pilus assembly protein PilF
MPSVRASAIGQFAVLAALSAALFPSCRAEPAAAVPPPSGGGPIVLITIDTLRADRLGAYGSPKGLTPVLDQFARDAVRFTAAVTQVPLTLPAHASLLTGLHPARHGVRTNDGFHLAPTVPTLAESLRAGGYATGAFIGGDPLRASSGLARGFEQYDDAFLQRAGAVERSADEVAGAVELWIEQHKSRPFFVWAHLFDPHSPYTPPAPYAAAYADAPYDGEVAYTDAAIGRLFEWLKARNLFSESTIVIVADHGEALGDHGERTHGTFLYDATIRVPMIVKPPRASGARVVDVPVEIADLAPTIAALAGVAMPPVDGQNLLPLIAGSAGDADRPAYAESYYQNVLLGWSPLRAVRTRGWKFIEAPRPELYDLEADPGEQQNRAGDRGTVATALQRALPSASSEPSSQPSAAAGEAAERLRSLGYVSGSTRPTVATRGIDPKDRVEVWAHIEDGIDRLTTDPAAARQAFTEALRLDPGNGLATKYLADISFRAGRLREARAAYQQAIAAGFRHPDAFVNLAAIAEREGRQDEARDNLKQAIALNAFDADAQNRLGVLELRRGDLNAARRAFTQAIAAAPENAEPHYNLAIVERRAGNEASAQTHLRDALARNPAYPEANYELGTGYLIAKQPTPALDAYRAALATRPDYAEALFGAARAALDLGQPADARQYYEHFVRVAPREYARQVAAAREALTRLAAK